MTVRELNREQLDELRWSLYYDADFMFKITAMILNVILLTKVIFKDHSGNKEDL
jgi:hypothetical protein